MSKLEVKAQVPITEQFNLPSNGRIEGVPRTVTMRCMTTFEEKMRLSSGSVLYVIKSILKSCIVDPTDLDIDALPDFDIWYLIYKLRAMTYGSDYKFSVRCSTCGALINTSTNIDELDVIELPDEFVEPVEITYPQSEDVIGLRLLRSGDIDKIDSESTKIKLKSPEYVGDPAYLLRFEYQIATINGEKPTKMDLKKYVQSITGRDSAYHQHQYGKIAGAGIVNQVSIECPECGSVDTYMLPFNGEFFRPTYDE